MEGVRNTKREKEVADWVGRRRGGGLQGRTFVKFSSGKSDLTADGDGGGGGTVKPSEKERERRGGNERRGKRE